MLSSIINSWRGEGRRECHLWLERGQVQIGAHLFRDDGLKVFGGEAELGVWARGEVWVRVRVCVGEGLRCDCAGCDRESIQ